MTLSAEKKERIKTSQSSYIFVPFQIDFDYIQIKLMFLPARYKFWTNAENKIMKS